MISRLSSDFIAVLDAHEVGGASGADIIQHLMTSSGRNTLSSVSGYRPSELEKRYPVLEEYIPIVRRRIIEIELGRGDLPTPASNLASSLRYTGGMDILIRILQTLGNANFTCGYNYDFNSKSAVLSSLIRGARPGKNDKFADFSKGVKVARISTKRQVELAVYAPQWADYVEKALDWDGLKEGVLWLHAHTKGIGWQVGTQIKKDWLAEISEYTSLTGNDLIAGAVDVAWFNRVYTKLGSDRWKRVYQAAKYTAGGNGHTRAKLFSDALLGQVTSEDLIARIKSKRHQDSVRALGLIPLINGSDQKSEILERYRILQEFLRTSRKFGSQRRNSEKLALSIGIANLARTAGYSDPRRLEWEMEAEYTADLSGGMITANADDVEVTLSVTSWGDTQLRVSKNNRTLKNIPPRVKKDPQIANLLNLRKKVKEQGSRMRKSLEESMVRGDSFTGEDLETLLDHPILGTMLSQLVFVGDQVIGFPTNKGRILTSHDGTISPLSSTGSFRIAHPYDLFQSGEWHYWQKICFREERVQPFKQIFRELYLLTTAEKRDEGYSQRYAGQQVNPKQAFALLGTRLWISNYDEGIKRTFHHASITAQIDILNTWLTPGEIDGVTLEGVFFSRSGERNLMNLDDVPPRLFSEVMRDLDLVVSVAHRGGVDPEASHSTIEMRTAILRETIQWLNLNNVQLKESWVLIEGQRATYNVHMGSGVVHKQPGGTLCIIPIHSQHRGRIFLPFVDNDPKTAEIISKVLLLAKDEAIHDPSILEQILHF
jgi:hypothetical protein